ncbi:hypothetical protein A2U01_0075947 [Trifolium medium]|uniref:Uncharacterized protein n=1 Tax=Trifolium medium TaxID=97028 RepID=A0A392T2U1_9FABA|nr:hypothetical protein [Trifolium medium]
MIRSFSTQSKNLPDHPLELLALETLMALFPAVKANYLLLTDINPMSQSSTPKALVFLLWALK